MIEAYCRTNLDGYTHCIWPRQFVAVPRIGDRVEALNTKMSLVVVGITHKVTAPDICCRAPEHHSPYIEIELNKPRY